MTNREIMLSRLKNVMKGQAMIIKEDNRLSEEERIEQLEIIKEIMDMIEEKELFDEKMFVEALRRIYKDSCWVLSREEEIKAVEFVKNLHRIQKKEEEKER